MHIKTSLNNVQIELSISKSENFCHQIESRMEQSVKAEKPQQMIRNSKLKQPFNTSLEVHLGKRCNAVLDQRNDPLLTQRENQKGEADKLKKQF